MTGGCHANVPSNSCLLVRTLALLGLVYMLIISDSADVYWSTTISTGTHAYSDLITLGRRNMHHAVIA